MSLFYPYAITHLPHRDKRSTHLQPAEAIPEMECNQPMCDNFLFIKYLKKITFSQVNLHTNITQGKTDEQMDEQTGGQMDGGTDRWTDRQLDRHRQMDE